MGDNPPEWRKQTFKLPDGILDKFNQGEFAVKPGYNVFIADRGAVGFYYPQDWVIIPTEDAIGLHDRKPPDDDCVLRVSVMRLPPVQGGWGGLPLSKLVKETLKNDPRKVTPLGQIKEEKRLALELAWAEVRFIDPVEKRPARSRCCLARANLVQPLITMEMWESDLAKFGPVWDEVLRSLRVGVELPGPPPAGLTGLAGLN